MSPGGTREGSVRLGVEVGGLPSRLLPVAVAAVATLLVLGPVLGQGIALSYDLAWSPDPRWTPFTLGIGTPAPRAVPGDAAVVALGLVVGAPAAQVLVLGGLLLLAGTGAARLAAVALPASRVLAPSVAALAGIWNPFVHERLVVGQWTVLLGYAATPHLVLLARRARAETPAGRLLAAAVVGCGAGGANTLLLALLAVVPVVLLPRPAWRALAWTMPAALGVAAVWVVPALAAGVRSGAAGAAAFGPRPDTPLGTLVSLISGGGFWNPATHPPERMSTLVALGATAAALAGLGAAIAGLRRGGAVLLTAPAAVGALLVGVSALDPGGLWTTVVTSAPGGGLLRDSQKLVAPMVVLAAAGSGVLVGHLARRGAPGVATAVVLSCLPVLTLPGLAWGAGGRLRAVEVPSDVRSTATRLSALPPGRVGVLPWSQYRRYGWNGGRTSLTLVPRMVDQQVLVDDALPLSSGSVPGEDPAAARVTAAIQGGRSPLEALEAEGVRYLVVERAAGPGAEVAIPASSEVLVDGPDVLVMDLRPGAPDAPVRLDSPALVAWWLSLATAAAAVLLAGHAALAKARRAPGRRATRW